jgi:UPF0042 nucleotide-binding protein
LSGTARESRARLILITGLSGSGKSTVGNCLEDLGYAVVDNLPLPLLASFLSDPGGLTSGRERIAVVADLRAAGFAAEAPRLWRQIDRSRLTATLVFLDSSDDALVRRFSETRRPHPLGNDLPLIEAVRRERELLSDLRGAADLVFDTSDWSAHDIRSLVYREFGRELGHEPEMSITLLSFGFKHGTPPGCDLLFDVRYLPNPHFEPELREWTGLDRPVVEFLDARAEFGELSDRLEDLLKFLLPRYRQENRSYLTVGVGCTGGRHRSVAVVERLASRLGEAGWNVRRKHREMEREGRCPPS